MPRHRQDGGFNPFDVFERNAPYAQPGPYQTQLSPRDEAEFTHWVQANRVPFDPTEDVQDYDMRGYWKDVASRGVNQTAKNQTDGLMHFPDTYKTPFHVSFSSESKYARPDAPSWVNDTQLMDRDGNVVRDERYFGEPGAVQVRGLPQARRR